MPLHCSRVNCVELISNLVALCWCKRSHALPLLLNNGGEVAFEGDHTATVFAFAVSVLW